MKKNRSWSGWKRAVRKAARGQIVTLHCGIRNWMQGGDFVSASGVETTIDEYLCALRRGDAVDVGFLSRATGMSRSEIRADLERVF